MYLTLSDQAQAGSIPPERLHAKVLASVMGNLAVDFVTVSKDAPGAASVPVNAVVNNLTHDPGSAVMFIAFQLDAGKGEPEVRRYVDARAPALAKHGGKVLLSGLTPRTDGWLFDGFELVQFPAPDTIRTLMGDPDYRTPDIQALSKIFSGSFAMLQVAVS
ncbi:DUF1330 domain-containing protein [Comamonas sp. JC664]|uniref:DUF1330 domain-containing protein n=1 Tax=Comamonas sp. JC664 TaxID=2801917 RepID=UPI00174A2877|nr:DUF1330 domain-containing protein [Comamonas sp. JC664]MBL0696313.1 DUF1330 domain-containing protein [Comamonas sp. JC664]GHG66423.1 hypothetical protein GCM10012319_08500 [Comamonas sp. KCTC 72670]